MNKLTAGIINVGDYKISKETLKEILRLTKAKYPDRKIKLEINFDEKLYQHMLNNPYYYNYPSPIIDIYIEGLTYEERKEFNDFKKKGISQLV